MEKIIKHLLYLVMKNTAKYTVHFFYRGITKIGKENIPKTGQPFIYAINHQNAFLDAVIVGGLSPTPTYFMTRSDVFKPPYDWFLDALHMMPIYRIRDGYGSLSKNDAIFETCKSILEDDKAILIFPEGNHGLDYYLRPLTKGVARIALQSQAGIDKDVKIVPVGLNYFDHFHSGNRLIIKYGEPLNMNDYSELYNQHPQKGYRQLMKDLKVGMESTLVIAQPSDNYENQKGIFQRKNEGLSFETLRSNLDNKELTAPDKTYPFLASLGRLFGLPNLLPLALCKYIIDTKVSQKIFQGSIRIAASIIIFPIWFLLCFALMWALFSFKWALGLLGIQLFSLWIRRELVRMGRP